METPTLDKIALDLIIYITLSEDKKKLRLLECLEYQHETSLNKEDVGKLIKELVIVQNNMLE